VREECTYVLSLEANRGVDKERSGSYWYPGLADEKTVDVVVKRKRLPHRVSFTTTLRNFSMVAYAELVPDTNRLTSKLFPFSSHSIFSYLLYSSISLLTIIFTISAGRPYAYSKISSQSSGERRSQ
jgi:hypothetical protein